MNISPKHMHTWYLVNPIFGLSFSHASKQTIYISKEKRSKFGNFPPISWDLWLPIWTGTTQPTTILHPSNHLLEKRWKLQGLSAEAPAFQPFAPFKSDFSAEAQRPFRVEGGCDWNPRRRFRFDRRMSSWSSPFFFVWMCVCVLTCGILPFEKIKIHMIHSSMTMFFLKRIITPNNGVPCFFCVFLSCFGEHYI